MAGSPNISQAMIRVLITDDHAVVRSGLREFISGCPGLEVVAEAGSGSEALSAVRSVPLDAMLLDLSLPDIDGIELLRRIKAEKPDLPVIVFSVHAEDEYAVHAMAAGASGYLNKGGPPEEIVAAIRTAAGGARYVSPYLAERLLGSTLQHKEALPHEKLSRREMEVLLQLSKGVPLTKIGEQLNLSVKTIGTYRARIIEKMSLASNAELTRYVLKHRLE